MKSAFYSGASGMIAFQQALDTTGNNIANVNTVGYKQQMQSFQDLLYTNMWVNNESEPKTGHGVRTIGTGSQMTDAPFMESVGDGYNYAIACKNGEVGMFAVEDADGNIFYTRNGAFTIDVEEEELMTEDGFYVLDSSGDHIAMNLEYDEDADEEEPLETQIGVYRFANPSALTAITGSRFQENEQSGEAEALDYEEQGYKLMHGYLEQSGINMQNEMMDVIIAQRAYQMSARVLQTSDEMEQLISTLRK